MGINVQRSGLKLKQGQPCKRNWSIELTASVDNPETEDPNIFVYHCQTTANNEPFASFNNIANLQDMNIIPIANPTEIDGPIWANNISYFRTSTVTLDFYNTEEMEEHWHWIKKQIRDLVAEQKAATTLTPIEGVNFN